MLQFLNDKMGHLIGLLLIILISQVTMGTKFTVNLIIILLLSAILINADILGNKLKEVTQ